MEPNEIPETKELNAAQRNVAFYLPALLEITCVDPDFPWDRIDRNFSALWKTKSAQAIGDVIKVEMTLFFMMMSASKGNMQAIGMLHFLNLLFEELSDQLHADEKKLICSNIKDIIQTPNLMFFNFVGEIATLNNLMKTKEYRLSRVEAPLGNGSSIDFQLKKLNNNILLVEIVNIHLGSERVEADPIAIDKFLTNRLMGKIEKKKKGLKENIDFYLIPVLWGGWKEIEVYSTYFKSRKLTIANVIEPVAYLQHSNGLGYFDHQFGRVSTLIRKDS